MFQPYTERLTRSLGQTLRFLYLCVVRRKRHPSRISKHFILLIRTEIHFPPFYSILSPASLPLAKTDPSRIGLASLCFTARWKRSLKFSQGLVPEYEKSRGHRSSNRDYANWRKSKLKTVRNSRKRNECSNPRNKISNHTWHSGLAMPLVSQGSFSRREWETWWIFQLAAGKSGQAPTLFAALGKDRIDSRLGKPGSPTKPPYGSVCLQRIQGLLGMPSVFIVLMRCASKMHKKSPLSVTRESRIRMSLKNWSTLFSTRFRASSSSTTDHWICEEGSGMPTEKRSVSAEETGMPKVNQCKHESGCGNLRTKSFWKRITEFSPCAQFNQDWT